MNKFILLALCGLLAFQLVSSQSSRTTWSAAQVPGLGMTTAPPDFTDYQINMAIAQVNAAQTENQAAYAAAAVYNPAMDMADAVQQALETKVRQLRTPPGWAHPIPPPLPFNFDVMNLVMGAYYGTLNRNAPQSKASNTPPMSGPPYNFGPPAGPASSIRRGPRPGPARGMAPGPGGMYSPFEPTQWELDMAVHNINTATTEVGAVKAAAGVYRIGLDLADVVVNAVEEKISRLRNPNWMRPRPPPIPRGLNVLRMVTRAFHEIQQAQQAKAAADAARAAADSARAAAKAAKANKPPPPTPGAPQPPPPPQQAPKPGPPPPPAPKPMPAGPGNRPPTPQTPPSQYGQQDFMSNYIQKRRQLNVPPQAPNVFKNIRPTNPPYVKQTPVKPVNPYPNQPYFRPLPSQDAFKPPPNVPTPPKINWNTKPPKSIEKAMPPQAPEPSNGRFSSSYDPPSALPDMISPKRPEPKKPMRIPKANLPPPPPRQSEPRGPVNLFPKRNTKRPSDIPKAVLSSEKSFKKESAIFQTNPTTPTPSPKEKEIFNRYPGLFENKAKERAARRRKHKLVSRRKGAAKSNNKVLIGKSSQIKLSVPYQTVQIPAAPKQKAIEIKPKSPKPSKIWSPLGNLGSNINEILKFSIGGPSDSVPIPTKNPPKPTTRKPTTTKRPTRSKPKLRRRVKKPNKQNNKKKVAAKAKPKSIPIAVSTRVQKPKKEPKSGGNDTLKQLELLLKGITPSQLQTLVDLIQAKSNEGKPKPTPKPVAEVKPRQLYIPPPPGSENRGPSREMRGNQGIPLGGQQRNGPMPGQNMDYGPQNNMRGGPPPNWNRGGPGGPMGQGPMGQGPMGRGPMGGSPMGGPMGPQGGPQGGPFGGLDMNNPQVARLIRVLKTGGHPKNLLSGRSQGGAAAAGGEAPEAGEGPTNLLGNPLMMGMLMNNQGGQGGGLASLLGGGGGGAAANPLAALLAGGGGAGGGGQMDIMSLIGGNGGSGQNTPPADGGMNPALLALMQGGGGGSGAAGGLGALGGLGGLGGLGMLGGFGA